MANEPQSAQHATMAAAEAESREAAAGGAAAQAAAAAAAGTRRLDPPVQHRGTCLLASTETLAGLIGAVICLAFVLSPKTPPPPVAQLLGMAFTTATCPLLLALAPGFYARHRTAVVTLVRLGLLAGTAYNYGDIPLSNTSLSWVPLLLSLLYASRALVACWGAFAWRLPLPMHAAVQLLHVAVAGWQLAPAVCADGCAIRSSADKLQQLGLLLDFPLRMAGTPPELLAPRAACLALTVWTQLAFAFLLPTAVLLTLNPSTSMEGEFDDPCPEGSGLTAASLAAAQLLWLLVRLQFGRGGDGGTGAGSVGGHVA